MYRIRDRLFCMFPIIFVWVYKKAAYAQNYCDRSLRCLASFVFLFFCYLTLCTYEDPFILVLSASLKKKIVVDRCIV